MSTGSEVFEIADRYLISTIDLDALDVWLAEHAALIAQLKENDPAAELAGLVQVTLAEMDDGVASEAELRARLDFFFEAYQQRLNTQTGSIDRSLDPASQTPPLRYAIAPPDCRTYSSLSGMLVISCSSA